MPMRICAAPCRAPLLAAMLAVTVYACGDADLPAPAPLCERPQPLLLDEVPTGFEDCAAGFIHRTEVLSCPSFPLPRGSDCTVSDACDSDATCATIRNGYCNASCQCDGGCLSDADCDPGSICMCGEPLGRCMQADCTSDADCDQGLCIATPVEVNCAPRRFVCQTSADACAGDNDCGRDDRCVLVDGARACVRRSCGLGG